MSLITVILIIICMTRVIITHKNCHEELKPHGNFRISKLHGKVICADTIIILVGELLSAKSLSATERTVDDCWAITGRCISAKYVLCSYWHVSSVNQSFQSIYWWKPQSFNAIIGFVAILHRSLLIRNLLCCRLPAAIHAHYTSVSYTHLTLPTIYSV